MDDLIETLLESLFEGLIDGIDSASTSKRLPVGLRILFAVLLFLFFGGVFGFMVFAGVMLIKESSWLPGLLMFSTAALILGYLIHKFVKIFNGRSG